MICAQADKNMHKRVIRTKLIALVESQAPPLEAEVTGANLEEDASSNTLEWELDSMLTAVQSNKLWRHQTSTSHNGACRLLWCSTQLIHCCSGWLTDIADGSRVVYELFHTSHVMDGLRCRADFNPSFADDAKRPDGTLHGMMTRDSPQIQYFKQCIIATGDRLLFEDTADQPAPYGDLSKECSTNDMKCLRELAAVQPRPDVPQELECLLDIDGEHWQVLNTSMRIYLFTIC